MSFAFLTCLNRINLGIPTDMLKNWNTKQKIIKKILKTVFSRILALLYITRSIRDYILEYKECRVLKHSSGAAWIEPEPAARVLKCAVRNS